MLKYLACLIGLVALAAAAPAQGQAHPKPAQVQKQDQAQGNAPTQKQGAGQKPPPAQGQAPAQEPSASTSAPQSMGPPAPPPPAPPPPDQVPIGPVLDKLSASLKQIEASLEHHDLTDADLQDLRQQIDPISAAVGDAFDRLSDAPPHRDQDAPRPVGPETGRFGAARKPGGDSGARRSAKAL